MVVLLTGLLKLLLVRVLVVVLVAVVCCCAAGHGSDRGGEGKTSILYSVSQCRQQ